jgi:hypothetical protein
MQEKLVAEDVCPYDVPEFGGKLQKRRISIARDTTYLLVSYRFGSASKFLQLLFVSLWSHVQYATTVAVNSSSRTLDDTVFTLLDVLLVRC